MNRVLKCVIGCAIVLAATTASAQDPKVEIGGTLGWTFSDGVSGDAVTVPGVGTFNSIDPKDAFSWGLRIGFFVDPHSEVGFLYNQQSTTVEVRGTLAVGGSARTELGDESIRNYHGYFAYNFGEPDDVIRPYVLGGLGATQYGSVQARIGDTQREVGGTTRFSSTWAGGIKVNANKRVGLRAEARWTPTYIKSDATGWWCDPFWGCYVVGNAQYSNQFELSGGLNFRF